MNRVDEGMIECRKCSAEIDPLAVFPGRICLACHAKKVEHLSPEDLLNQIVGGFGSEAVAS